jgi:hypothetical protein
MFKQIIYSIFLILILSSLTAGQIPNTINYQGVLTDNSGNPVPDGNYMLSFKLYNVDVEGTSLWDESQTVETNNGIFNAKLGSVVALTVPFDETYWLGITVESDGTELSPRVELTPSAYSIMAKTVEDESITTDKLADGSVTQAKLGSDVSFTSPWTTSGSIISYTGTAVGIRTPTPTSTLTVKGNIDLQDFNSGVRGMRLYGGNVGAIDTRGPAGSRNVLLSYISGNEERGFIGVYNASSQSRSYLSINSNDVGNIILKGANDKSNVVGGQLINYPNNGFIGVYDGSGNEQAGMYVNSSGQGIVYGDVKNFKMDHPTEANSEIWYASLEGPEAAAYLRGTAKLINGTVSVDFPSHFKHVIQDKGMTVMLTPLSAESNGLAVVQKSANGFTVVELDKGTGSYEFDWEVKSVRRGFEDYEVVRQKGLAEPQIDLNKNDKPYGEPNEK